MSSRLIRDFALEVHFSRHEFTARYNLTGSDAESRSVGEILSLGTDEDRKSFRDLSLGYTETYGAPRLRATIANTYDHSAINAARIMTFAGAQEAMYVLSRVVLEPDDHAICVTPNYQSAETIPLSICEATGIPLDPDDRWRLDVDQLIAAIRPNTRLVSINFPNNPTGAIIPATSLNLIVDVCRARGIWLLSDEVYRLIERDPAMRLPQVADLYERGISLNVLSKAYGLPGLRIGWLACQDGELLQRCERYKHYLSICNSAPSEVLGRIALEQRETLLTRNRGIVSANLTLLDDFFTQWPDLFDWARPDGSCVAFPRYKGDDGVEAFTDRLVNEAGVLLLPASIYRSDLNTVPADHFRIGFGRLFTQSALEVFAAWLKDQAL